MLKPAVTQLVGRIERRARSGPYTYRTERTVVAVMFEVLGRLLEAASQTDEVVKAEMRGFPEGYTIGFSVLGDALAMRVKVEHGRFVRYADHGTRPALDITFKHIAHAFHVLTFQESTAQAFANDRAITNGDIALAMRFVRCLNRVQAVALPPFVASRALKAPLPNFARGERAALTAKLYAQLTKGLFSRSAP